jgi:hypothetical protein
MVKAAPLNFRRLSDEALLELIELDMAAAMEKQRLLL